MGCAGRWLLCSQGHARSTIVKKATVRTALLPTNEVNKVRFLSGSENVRPTTARVWAISRDSFTASVRREHGSFLTGSFTERTRFQKVLNKMSRRINQRIGIGYCFITQKQWNESTLRYLREDYGSAQVSTLLMRSSEVRVSR